MEQSALRARNEIPVTDQWNLTPLFNDESAWESAYSDVEAMLPRYSGFKGTVAASAQALLSVIEFDLDVSRRIDRIYTYAHLKSDEDKTNQRYLGFMERMSNLAQRVSETSSWIMPEIMAIDTARMNELASDKLLAPYRFYLEKILRMKAHTLSESEERLMALSQETLSGAHEFFSQLENADMKFGTIVDDNGSARELTHGNFITFLMSENRDFRKRVFEQYYAQFEAHKHALATAHASSVKGDYFYATARHYDSVRSSALYSDNINNAVYDNLIATVKKNLAPLFSYYGTKKKFLGVSELHAYDLYAPLVKDIDFHMSYDEAVETCIEALAPLGSEYCAELKKGLTAGWVDRYENRGKRSGAYSSGCYDSPPYILMNYEPKNIGSVYTLIHEAGHSMHSLYSRKKQPYVYHNYTIFVAEVASTVNESLLTEHLMKRYSGDERMKRYILNREIEDIRATLVRQTMFAEFEMRTHAMREANEPLTLESLTALYTELLNDYFGTSMVIDKELTLEYLRIPHFYSSFYVYKYATGISAALAISRALADGTPDARKRYHDFLGLGGSAFPLDELKTAGVDLSTPAPIEDAMRHLAGRIAAFAGV
ncbi:MAG: oligoendopeptidase F [Spirochaetes bacterium]|nr:oligoendopeptidase F [Spirochaetota bacterium]